MIALAALALLQILDTYTTVTILNNGGREHNKLLVALFNRFGVVTVLAGGKSLMLLGFALVIDQPYAVEVVWALCVIYAVVVGRNWRQMKHA